MRTKTLMAAASILAAGALSSMAQSSNVYSLNIVGYANIPIALGNQLYANPFTTGVSNGANEIFSLSPVNDNYAQPAGTMNSFTVLTWNGNGFNHVFYESAFTGTGNGDNGAGGLNSTNGWATDNSGSVQAFPPALPPGKGFFINNAGNASTNTFVGNVVPAPGTTNNLAIALGNQLYGSVLPVGGQFDSPALQVPLSPVNDNYAQPPGTMNSFTVLTWNGNGYNHVFYESAFTGTGNGDNGAGGSNSTNGWATDNSGSVQAVPPTITVGQGFFINNAGNTATWSQTLTNAP